MVERKKVEKESTHLSYVNLLLFWISFLPKLMIMYESCSILACHIALLASGYKPDINDDDKELAKKYLFW